MHLRPLLVVFALAALAAVGTFAPTALAELTVNESFEYDSPGMTFEGQHVGPAHCKAKYQVNPRKFPEKENETALGPFGPSGGREVVTCKSTTRHPISGNVAPGSPFPLLSPNDYWVSEWFLNHVPGKSCFVITLPDNHVTGKMSASGRSYHVVAYLEYDRECH